MRDRAVQAHLDLLFLLVVEYLQQDRGINIHKINTNIQFAAILMIHVYKYFLHY